MQTSSDRPSQDPARQRRGFPARSAGNRRESAPTLEGEDALLLGSMPTWRNISWSAACTFFEARTTRTWPRCRTAIGPRFIRNPAKNGPVHVNWPSPRAATLNSPASGTWPGTPDVSPSAKAAVRPTPTSCACLAETRSISKPATASRASRSSSAASRPVVSPLPPAPGLSCVSASTTGAPGCPAGLRASPHRPA